jgi:NTE family protein
MIRPRPIRVPGASPTATPPMNQDALTFDVALEGGGSRGIALCGAIAEILGRGHVIRRLVGTSAGAITAALVAAGFTGDELLEMSLGRTPEGLPLFSEYVTEPIVPLSPDVEPVFTDVHLAALRLPAELGRRLLSAHAALAFLDRGGFVSGEGFMGWLVRTLEGKRRGLSRVTLQQLFALTRRHLTVIATDTTARRLRALNHVSAPDCPLVWAVRMSMSIPLFFAEVVWRASWGLYGGEAIAGHVLVDGGVLSNLPIAFILPSANALMAALMGPPPEGDAFPVGLILDTTLDVPNAPPAPASSAFGALSTTRLGQRLTALTETMLHGVDMTLSDAASVHLCRLPARSYGITEFDMTEPRAKALVSAAAVATGAYLEELERSEST